MTTALERLKAQRADANRPTRTISVQRDEYKLDRLKWYRQVDACTTLLVMDGEKTCATLSSPGRTPDDPYSNDDVHALMAECEALHDRAMQAEVELARRDDRPLTAEQQAWENERFWQTVDAAAAEVATWPEWRRCR